MKYSFPLFCGLALLLLSCSKNDTGNPKAATPINPTTVLASGNFIVSSFTQKTEDKTSLFSGMVFNFSASGTVTASNKGSITSGKWTYTPSSVGYYGSTGSKSSLTIDLGTIVPYDKISKVWNIDSTRSSVSRLSLINPEPIENEQLEFSKQ